MPSVSPYLGFNDTCGPAFELYKSVFGGEYQTLMRFKDVPGQPPADGEKVMHVSLPIGGGTYLMGSDRPSQSGKGVPGDHFNVSLQADSKAEADRVYKGLSAGGKATMPMADVFWGSYFGMLTDRFGIQWMIGFDPKQAK
jgi:PhnB protein